MHQTLPKTTTNPTITAPTSTLLQQDLWHRKSKGTIVLDHFLRGFDDISLHVREELNSNTSHKYALSFLRKSVNLNTSNPTFLFSLTICPLKETL